MTEKSIYEVVTLELRKQHITAEELKTALCISDSQYEAIRNGKVPAKLLIGLSQYLGCTCDYLCGRSEDGAADEATDRKLGFTCKGRIDRLFEQLDEAQQWEVYDMISQYCLSKGITYSRIDAEARRENLINGILMTLGKEASST